MMNRTLTAALLAGAVLLSGCDKEPTGQVAAVVNGEEITLQEINTELGGQEIPEGADEEQIRSQVLARIIDRRLLAQAAREDGLDQTPEYLVRRRQLEDALLVQLLQQREERAADVPDQRAIDSFIAENKAAFADRELYVIERIQFPNQPGGEVMAALEPAKSMDAVAKTLTDLGIEFSRQPARMDSARLPTDVIGQIKALPAGEPFILPEGNMVTVGVIRETQAVPATTEEARPAALQAMRQRDIRTALETRLEAAKAKAEITYQPGFDNVDGTKPSQADDAASTTDEPG